MQQRKRLKSAEIEAFCVRVLQTQIGLKHLTYAKIRPYTGEKSWTWELCEAGPDVTQMILDQAESVIAELLGDYDLLD